jgi:hypothetical protein
MTTDYKLEAVHDKISDWFLVQRVFEILSAYYTIRLYNDLALIINFIYISFIIFLL